MSKASSDPTPGPDASGAPPIGQTVTIQPVGAEAIGEEEGYHPNAGNAKMGRGVTAMSLKGFLVQQEIDFAFLEKESTHHAEEAARATGLPLHQIAKTLVFMDEAGALLVAVVRADHEVGRHKLCAAAGRKSVRVAPAEVAEKATGYPTGGIPPVGHRRRLPVFLDRKLASEDFMWFGGGARSKLVRLKVADVLRLSGAAIADISIQ